MALRTIEAPGVEIKEIDKSGYTPVMTGTKCFVMGYSDKGTPYEPMQFTSKAAWQLYYGDPDNEAERYFYNACSEVINQNGVLNCARLPYDNKAYNKMVGFKFKVRTTCEDNPTAGEYLSCNEVKYWVDHNTNFEKDSLAFCINNKTFREVDGVLSNGFEHYTEIKQYYNTVIDRFNKTYNTLNNWQRYSIAYYYVDKEESKKLAKRFLTYKEATRYLDETYTFHRGNYWIQCDYEPMSAYDDETGQCGACLVRDRGDWIAQPLYRKYFKESERIVDVKTQYGDKIPHLVTYGKDWDKQWVVSSMLSNDHGLREQYYKYFTEKNLSATENDKDLSGIYKTVKDNIYTINLSSLNEQMTTAANKRKFRSLLSSTSDGLMYYDDLTKSYDLLKNACEKDVTKVERNEIPRDGYLSTRVKYLNEYTDEMDLIAVDTTIPQLVFNVFEYKRSSIEKLEDVRIYCDGAHNEWMFEQKVNDLYNDDYLKMKDQEGISDLYSHELWVKYQEQTLSSILKENSLSTTGDISSFSQMLETYKAEGGIKYTKVLQDYDDAASKGYDVSKERIRDHVPYYAIVDLDPNMDKYLEITRSMLPISMSLDKIDEYRSGESKVDANTFWVFDKTCATLNSISEDKRKGDERQMIGIFPVITTAANALYAQSLIQVDSSDVINYESIDGTITKSYDDNDESNVNKTNKFQLKDIVTRFCQNDRTEDEVKNNNVIYTVSRDANGYFLPIQMNSSLDGVDTENMKKIGVVVYKAYLDASEGNKVSFTPVESFVGSLDKDDKNPNTGVSTFIDKIINTQSDYIYFFSNCFVNTAQKKTYNNEADFFVCKAGTNGMLGWFEKETVEEISLTSLYQSIDKCFTKLEDINERDIDIVCDAGLANIAQYMKSVYEGSGAHAYDLQVTDDKGNPLIKNWTCNKQNDVIAWKTVLFKYDNFCKNVRKDCMFIADSPRPICLQGELKIVRPSKPTNTIDANILPNVKYITGLNTNYGAGYCDWFQITDEFTGDEFWCPPSIKAMGVYINTDLNFNYWDAPAGLNRGVIQALDCAFSPTVKQAGSIYTKNWNYAINYPYDGIVLEGQKTFQVKPSAFDRVNVRRLFLRLERQTYKVARYFVYEGNIAYTRQRLVDMLDPIFYQAKVGGGIYDYKIICDESNNTPNVIDNNELRVKIGIKPVKTAEFILIDFIALPTGGSFSEM